MRRPCSRLRGALAAAVLLALAACAAAPDPPGPEREEVAAVPAPPAAGGSSGAEIGVDPALPITAVPLRAAVPLELVGGMDLGSLDLHEVRRGGAAYLAIRIDAGPRRLPILVCLPARFRRVPEGSVAALDGSLPLEMLVPNSASGAVLTATYRFGAVTVESAWPDGREDALDIDFEVQGDVLRLDLAVEERGPPRFGPFGRPLLARGGPVRHFLDRARGFEGLNVWVGPSSATPAGHRAD